MRKTALTLLTAATCVVALAAPASAAHGALVVTGLNDLWNWVDNELTLLVVPGAGHGPHAELPEFVTPRILDWLAARAHPALVYPPPRR